MQYFSTRDAHKQNATSFLHAVLNGLAPDGGLYMPATIPKLSKEFIQELPQLTLHQAALQIATAFIGIEIPEPTLKTIIEETLNFPLPIVPIQDNIYTLELFHGPTLAFKDVGARFMSRVMSYGAKQLGIKKIKVIVATSGDTGGAVAAGFYNIPNIEVYILYPNGMVSPLQEKQLTTWGGNIHALCINGTFDDCQKIAKEILQATPKQNDLWYTSANSINFARMLPQSFYYLHLYQWFINNKEANKNIGHLYVSVPSGNFGNIGAGLLIQQMGLPIKKYIAATNANNTFPNFIKTGKYEPKPSIATTSNAMDVGNPSNFERLAKMYNNNIEAFRACINALSFTDEEVALKIKATKNYLLDPHGAIGFLGIEDLAKENPEDTFVFLETAHPAKFKEVMENILQQPINVPSKLAAFASNPSKNILCKNSLEDVASYINSV